MLRHVAVFRWKPGTTPDQVEALSAGLARLPALIPEIRGYRFGPDAGLADGNADFAVVADFDDEEGWRAYMAHPDHHQLIAELVVPIRAERMGVQVRFSPP